LVLRWQAGYDLDNILNETMRDCVQAWKADSCAVLVLQAAHNCLVLRASIGLDLSVVHPIAVANAGSDTLTQAAKEHVAQWLGRKLPSSGRDAVFAFPLLFRQMPVGVLCVSREASKFDRRETESAAWQALSAQIACAIFWEETTRHLLAQERIEKDRHFAHMLKSRILPSESPALSGYRLAIHCLRCMEVGGDFWDFVQQPNGRLIFLLGESSGRGIKASLNIAQIMLEIRRLLAEGASLSATAVALNQAVIKEGGRKHMVNLCLGEIDPAKNRVSLVRAGTIRAVLCKDSNSRPLAAAGAPLGVFSDYAAAPQAISLPSGAALALITDGFGQCENPAGNRYSIAHLLRFLAERFTANANTSADKPLAVDIAEHIESYSGGQMLNDDVAILTVECLK